jgi:hypothetical protein
MKLRERFAARMANSYFNVGFNCTLAAALGALALLFDNWVHSWLWFCAGFNFSAAIFTLMSKRLHAKQLHQMREEMHAIGADVVRRMREHDAHLMATLVPNPPRDEPRLH